MRPWPLAVGLLLLAGLWLGPGVLRLLPGDFAPRHRYLGAFAASVYDFAVVWGWHLPVLHEAAARMNSAFAVQQLSFLTAGLALWWVCLAGRDARSDAAGAFAMLFASMHMAMLGVLLVLAQTLIYAPQFCLGAFGLDPLPDQQFGGGLMALFGALPYVVGGAYLASRLALQKT